MTSFLLGLGEGAVPPCQLIDVDVPLTLNAFGIQAVVLWLIIIVTFVAWLAANAKLVKAAVQLPATALVMFQIFPPAQFKVTVLPDVIDVLYVWNVSTI